MTFVNGGGLGFGPVGLPNAVGDGVQGNANIAPDITGLLQRMQDPVKLTQKVGEKFGDKPDQIQKLLTQLQQLGRPLKPDENLLKELLQLLLHAIQTGQLPQFLQSMGQGGGLGGLMNGLRGGGGGGGGGGGQKLE